MAAQDKYESVKKGLLALKVYDVDLEIVEMFASQRSVLRKKGKLIDNMDLLIASTVWAHNLVLITGNEKHFRRIKGLKILAV